MRIFSNVWFKLNLESQRKDDLRKQLVAAFVTAGVIMVDFVK